MSLWHKVRTRIVSSYLRSLDLDVAAGCESAGQLTGGAGSPHLVDRHVGSSLSLLGHNLVVRD